MPKQNRISYIKNKDLEVAPSDFNQAVIRFIVVSGLLVWSLYRAEISQISDILAHNFVLLTISYWAFSFVFLGWCRALTLDTKASPSKYRVRRITGVIADLGAISAYTAIAGTNGLILYPIYLTTIIGYGYRFGSNYLYLSIICGLLGFSLAISLNRTFAEISLVIAYYIGLILVPLYSLLLLKRHEKVLQRLKQVNESRSRFIANMSHELRTPLHAIININQVLKEEICTDNSRRREFDQFNMVGDSAEHLLKLVNRVLDIASSDAKSFNQTSKSRSNLFVSIKRAFNISTNAALEKGLRPSLYISPDIPAEVLISQTPFEEVLVNIIGNAVKYTDEGYVHTHVTSISSPDSDDIKLLIRVIDSGSGIPQSLLPNIFEPFTIGDDTLGRKHSGTGLGLTITRQHVESLGGSIEISSIEGTGTCVELAFPLTSQNILKEEHINNRDLRCLIAVSDEIEEQLLCQERPGLTLRPLKIGELGSPVSLESKLDCDAVLVPLSLIDRPGLKNLIEKLQIPAICLGSEDLGSPTIGDSPPLFLSTINLDTPKHIKSLNNLLLRYDPQSEGNQWREAEPATVLVADDNEINRKTAKLSLESCGHTVDTANDGEMALEMLAAGDYDIVLMDMHMPKLDGIDAAKLYSYEEEHPIPIVLLTADASDYARNAANEADIAAFLTKPIKPDELRAAVAKYAKRRGDKAKIVSLPNSSSHNSQSNVVSHREGTVVSTSELNELSECGASKEELLELIDIFEVDCKSNIEAALTALSNSELSVAQENMHALKGAAAAIGATSLIALASKLEESQISEIEQFELFLADEMPVLLRQSVTTLKEKLNLTDTLATSEYKNIR